MSKSSLWERLRQEGMDTVVLAAEFALIGLLAAADFVHPGMRHHPWPWKVLGLVLGGVFLATGVALYRGRKHAYRFPAASGQDGERVPAGLLSPGTKLGLVLFLILGSIFVIVFIGQERMVYCWDLSFFWSKYIHISDLFLVNPVGCVQGVVNGLSDNGNNLIPLLLFPWSLLFGLTRTGYVLSLTTMFGGLAVVSYLVLYRRFLREIFGGSSEGLLAIPLITLLTFPFYWDPILFGHDGVAGIFVINVILGIYLRDMSSNGDLRRVVGMGLLLPVLILLRRWYGFWVVSFIAAFAAGEFITALARRPPEPRRWLRAVLRTASLGLTAGLLLLILMSPFVLRVLGSPLTAPYGAWRVSPNFVDYLALFVSHYGPFFLTLFFSGVAFTLFQPRVRIFAAILLLQGMTILGLFYKFQDLSSQHHYLLQPTMLLFIPLPVIAALRRIRAKAGKAFLFGGYGVLCLWIFWVTFSPGVERYETPIKKLSPGMKHYPFIRDDIGEIRRLLNVLDGLMTDPGDAVYVLASSQDFNYDTLHNFSLSFPCDTSVPDRMLLTHDVDQRGGFPGEFFKARYVVVADPIQYHLRPEDQRVIGVLAEAILNRRNIGTSYVRLPYGFRIKRSVAPLPSRARDIMVYIYEKVRPYRAADVRELSDIFKESYPSWVIAYGP